MSDSSADKNQPAGNDVSSYYSAGNAGKEAAKQGILKKSILQYIHLF